MFKVLATILVFLGIIALISEITGSGKFKAFSIVGASAFIIILLRYIFHKSEVRVQDQNIKQDKADE